ncbi:hypothetical protein [Priestia sp. JSM ZJ58]|uniref:hypothetical protein n=1 Tax=Priestia sp. JSM ZJ58 TaxID=3376189 RepID=UPI003798757C
MGWINASDNDGDAVGFDFVESRDGSYTICIYPETDRLMERNIPHLLKNWINPTVASVTYCKKIDHVSDNYIKFKKAAKFSSLKIHLIKNNSLINGGSFVKKNINFFFEDTIPSDSILYGIFHSRNQQLDSKLKESRTEFKKKIKEDLNERRMEKIKYFFPISYEKINNNEKLKGIITELKIKYPYSSIIQAICNIVLDYRLARENHQEIIANKENFHINILNYLLENYEDFNSQFPDFNQIKIEDIEKQIELDSNNCENLLKEE